MAIKNARVRVKAGPDDGLQEGQFTAYASVFGNKDSYGDIVVPGAFAKTLSDWQSREAVIPLLFGHRMDDPDFNIGHVVTAAEDDHGLLVTAQLDLDNPKAAQTYRLLKGRRIDQMSFAYDVVDGGPAKKDGEDYYELRELGLYEVSVVPIGANQETEILAVKAQALALADGAKAGRTLSAKNESALKDARDAIDSVLSSLDDAGKDQEKASGTPAAKPDEEPRGAKSGEEPTANPSARALAELQLLALV